MIDVGVVLVALTFVEFLVGELRSSGLAGILIAILFLGGLSGVPVLQGYLLLTRGQSLGNMILKMRILRPDGSRVPGKNICLYRGYPLLTLYMWLFGLWVKVPSGDPVSPIFLMLSFCFVLWFFILWGSAKYDERQGIIVVKT